jgi:predicted nucleic acid-binding protein
MLIVADTSAFLAVALNEPEKEHLTELVRGHDLIAPTVLPYELGNALSAMLRKRRLDRGQVLATWEVVDRIPVELHDVDVRAALQIATSSEIYAYDAYFIQCSITSQLPLLTLDREMKRVGAKMGLDILE